jgi:hypothetical protein
MGMLLFKLYIRKKRLIRICTGFEILSVYIVTVWNGDDLLAIQVQ